MIEWIKIQNIKKLIIWGTKIKVNRIGDVIWNGERRNIYPNKDGYSVCSIKTNKGWRSVQVARLVALAFIPNPDNLPEVNHKDYNRANPHVDNLEWISRRDNVIYSNCNRPDYNGNKNPNYGNKKLSEIYYNNKEYAIEKQSRKGLKNGRCRKIKMYSDNEFIKEFDYIVDCCKYIQQHYSPNSTLDSIRVQIDKSIRLKNHYKKLTFIKE